MSNLVHKKDQLALLVSQNPALQDALEKNQVAQQQLRTKIAAIEDAEAMRAAAPDAEENTRQRDLVQEHVQEFTHRITVDARFYEACAIMLTNEAGHILRTKLRPSLDSAWFAHAITKFADAIKEAPSVEDDEALLWELAY